MSRLTTRRLRDRLDALAPRRRFCEDAARDTAGRSPAFGVLAAAVLARQFGPDPATSSTDPAADFAAGLARSMAAGTVGATHPELLGAVTEATDASAAAGVPGFPAEYVAALARFLAAI